MVFVRKIRGIFKNALLKHIPNFSGHFRFSGCANEECVRLELLLGKRFVNSIQYRAGSFLILSVAARFFGSLKCGLSF